MNINDRARGTSYHRIFTPATVPDRYRMVAERVGEGGRVLEVGCHTGYFSAVLKGRGCEVVGIEMNPDAAELARPILDDLVIGNADDQTTWDQVRGEFDTILLMDVLEHLYDPWTILRTARDMLAPGGRVLATLPNVACWSIRRELMKGRFVPDNTGLNDPTHIRWFTLETARELFGGAGLQVVSVDPVWTCIPLEHRMGRIPAIGKLWRGFFLTNYPNLAIAVPLIEARAVTP